MSTDKFVLKNIISVDIDSIQNFLKFSNKMQFFDITLKFKNRKGNYQFHERHEIIDLNTYKK